jgi:hypothetical protein
VDKYGDDPHKFAIGLKAGSYQNIFEWQNAVSETSAEELDLEVPAFTNWSPSSPSGQGDCVFMNVGGVGSTFLFDPQMRTLHLLYSSKRIVSYAIL